MAARAAYDRVWSRLSGADRRVPLPSPASRNARPRVRLLGPSTTDPLGEPRRRRPDRGGPSSPRGLGRQAGSMPARPRPGGRLGVVGQVIPWPGTSCRSMLAWKIAPPWHPALCVVLRPGRGRAGRPFPLGGSLPGEADRAASSISLARRARRPGVDVGHRCTDRQDRLHRGLTAVGEMIAGPSRRDPQEGRLGTPVAGRPASSSDDAHPARRRRACVERKGASARGGSPRRRPLSPGADRRRRRRRLQRRLATLPGRRAIRWTKNTVGAISRRQLDRITELSTAGGPNSRPDGTADVRCRRNGILFRPTVFTGVSPTHRSPRRIFGLVPHRC